MSQKQKILAVDDEPRNLRILLLSLGDEWEIMTAPTGEDALRILGTGGFVPDLVLLDIMMPGIDGYEVCRRIKAEPAFALTKVILISGKAMPEERLQGYEAGSNDYLTKPFVPEELLAKVKVFMDLTQVQRELQQLNSSLEEKVQYRTQQLVNTEAKLAEAARLSAMGEMAAGIAHEVNNPLAIIQCRSSQLQELIGEESLDRSEVRKIADSIEKTTKRISKIINGLRTLSRDGTHDPFRETSLHSIIESTLALCTEKFKTHAVELTVSELPESLTLECRETQIAQVLLNLINNAHDAIRALPQKWVRVDVIDQGATLRIEITDSGPGITPEIRDKIFQPFFTTKEIGQGTGLGLSISKRIVEAHGGTFDLDVQSLHTRFVISLPKKQDVGMTSAAS